MESMDGKLASVMVCTVHSTFCSFLMVLGRAVAVPGRYAPRYCAFYGASVKVGEDPYGHAEFRKPTKEEEVFFCLLDLRIYVGSPGEIVGYHHSQEFDIFNPLSLNSIDLGRGVFSSFLSEVNDQFFSFANIEREV
eukprot:g16426.t1